MPLGIHVSKTAVRHGKKKTRLMSSALRDDMDLLREWGIANPCAQIFVSGPQNYHETLTDAEKDAVERYVRETGIALVIHGAYVDNPWNRAHGAIHNIKQELRIAARLMATGVIVHLGAGAASDDALGAVLTEISNLDVNIIDKVTLWLEIHTAKASAATYETPEKLKRLFDRINALNLRLKIGLCIDTAHLFACGIALNTHAAAINWLDTLRELLPTVPLMLHLNDSASQLGSGKDAHAALGHGQLWGAYHPNSHLPIEDSGLVAILGWAETNDIVTILERDDAGIMQDLALINQLGYFRE